jgi:peptide/nickel transport system permease protein
VTAETNLAAPVKKKKRKKKSQFVTIFERLATNKLAMAGLIVMLLLILIAIFAPLIAPYSVTEQDYTYVLKGPCAKHLFGTDKMGRDIFSRCVYGARYSLSLGLIASLFTAVVGNSAGIIIGYIGGKVDMIGMRVCDVLSAIPGQLLAIVISTAAGAGFVQTIFAMSIGGIPMSARNSRAMCLKEREMEYLEAAHSINVPKLKIMFKHMLPNVMAPALVGTTMSVGNSIMGAAGLSFIGLGIQPPTPEWGAILTDGKQYVSIPGGIYMMLFPGILIAIVVLAVNLFGDGLRDAMDPRLKK